MQGRVLKKTKQQRFNKRIFGFDIETANKNKTFVMASIYSEEYTKFYYSKEEVIDDLKNNYIFRNSVIFATNLSFDFFGTFFNKKDSKEFFTLFRGSDLLLAKTYYKNKNFTKTAKIKTKSLKSLTFLDSLNFAKLSVSNMGDILKFPKLEKPEFLGHKPRNKRDWNILREYNLRDSEITYKFMKFLIFSFEELGATFKNTLASTSMSLFKNKYLDKDYIGIEEKYLLEQFESYFGGRTEAFSRGKFSSVEDNILIKPYKKFPKYLFKKSKISHLVFWKYYDFNSLYPAVMEEYEYPDPNTFRISNKNTTEYINNYHGISNIEIECPYMNYPLLPVRLKNGRVVFPTGTIKGWYTHIEILEALKLGYKIKNVYKTHYFTKTCRPFKEFVNDLYALRNKYKLANNIMEYVVKITMNSLYGKFGQRFLGKDNWVHESLVTIKDLSESESIERKGDYVRIVKDSEPSAFCIPVWASYVTAYGRIKLHRAILNTKPIYCDTDSLITRETFSDSKKLGKLKLEMSVKEAIIIRPKFYALKSDEINKKTNEKYSYVKIKGLGKRIAYFEFTGLLKNPRVEYDKFSKFKEAIRRDFIPNEIIETHKEFSLEDEKRGWEGEFSLNPQESKPITI